MKRGLENTIRMNLLSVAVVLAGVLLPVVLATNADAQRMKNPTAQEIEASEAKCRPTVAKVLNDPSDRERQFQLNLAGECPDTGAAVIAALWKNPPTDGDLLHVLVGNSRRMVDRRER